MGLENLLTNGGKVLIVGGYSKAWESYRKNPQMEFWTGEQKEISRFIRDREIPPNCKAVIISRFISHSELGQVMAEARRRQISMYPNLSDGEITRLLDEVASSQPQSRDKIEYIPERRTEERRVETKPPEIQATPVIEQPKAKTGGYQPGKMHKIDHLINLNEGDTDNARRILPLLPEVGITSTLLSIANYVGTVRRKAGGTSVKPKSSTQGKAKVEPKVEPKPEKIVHSQNATLTVFDAVIGDLQAMRDIIAELTEENRKLKEKFAVVEELFAKLKS